MKVIILAAGKGSRMKDLTRKTPKPLLEFDNGKKILDYILDSLPDETEEIFLVVGYLGDKIKNYVKKNNYNFKIIFLEQEKMNGTLGALKLVEKYIEESEKFLVLQGDDIHQKENIQEFSKLSWASSLGKIKMSKAYFAIENDGENFYKSKRRQTKGELENGAWIFSGMYMLDSDIFNFSEKSVFEGSDEIGIPQTLFSNLEKRKLKIFKEDNWYTANTKEEFLELNKKIKNL